MVLSLHYEKREIEEIFNIIRKDIGDDWRTHTPWSCEVSANNLIVADKYLYEKGIDPGTAINNIDVLTRLNNFLCVNLDFREVAIIEKDKSYRTSDYTTIKEYEERMKKKSEAVTPEQEQLYINIQALQTINYYYCNETLRDIIGAYNKRLSTAPYLYMLDYAINNIEASILEEKHTVKLNDYNRIIKVSVKDLLNNIINLLKKDGG